MDNEPIPFDIVPINSILQEPKTVITNTTGWRELGYKPRTSYAKPGEFLINRHEIFIEDMSPEHDIFQELHDEGLPNLQIMVNENSLGSDFQRCGAVALSRIHDIEVASKSDASWNEAITKLLLSHEKAHKIQHIRFGDEDASNLGPIEKFLSKMYREAQAVATEIKFSKDVPDSIKADRLFLGSLHNFADWMGLSPMEIEERLNLLSQSYSYARNNGTHPYAYITLATGDLNLIADIILGDANSKDAAKAVSAAINKLLITPEHVVAGISGERFQIALDQKLIRMQN